MKDIANANFDNQGFREGGASSGDQNKFSG